MKNMSKKTKYRKENKRLKVELSNVCWLLYESCIKNNFNSTNDIYSIQKYMTCHIETYGFPRITKIYDDYYEGYWMKCSWNEYEVWIWLQERNYKFTDILNNMYWSMIDYNSSDSVEYIWDDYYNGWWIFSEYDKANNLEWVWWG